MVAFATKIPHILSPFITRNRKDSVAFNATFAKKKQVPITILRLFGRSLIVGQ